ncbi:MAG: hypothetical protein JWM68_4504 [Verrucomicrobiales bacterium]|nr:hypothetical protein [Verrucomicrobiales bacterium]
MNDSTENRNGVLQMGWFIRLIGLAICAASIFFALGNKSSAPPYVIPFWACFAALVGVSTLYLIARRVSERWKSKAVRSYFSPYIIGATVWLLLILFFVVLDRIAG